MYLHLVKVARVNLHHHQIWFQGLLNDVVWEDEVEVVVPNPAHKNVNAINS